MLHCKIDALVYLARACILRIALCVAASATQAEPLALKEIAPGIFAHAERWWHLELTLSDRTRGGLGFSIDVFSR